MDRGTAAGVQAAQQALAAAATVVAAGSAEAQLAYTMMNEILQKDEAALIFPSLLLTVTSVGEGLGVYEATLLEAQKSYAQTQAAWQEAENRAGGKT